MLEMMPSLATVVWRASCAGWLLIAVCAPGRAQTDDAAESTDRGDAAIYRRIEQLRRATSRLRLDGLDRDWRDVPQMSDPRGDAAGDGSRDLVAVAIAPKEDDLWVMFRTAGGPSTDPLAFYLDVDMVGTNDDDFRLGLKSLREGLTLQLFDKDLRSGEPIPLPHAKVVVRNVVEMRIPYRDLAAAIPEDQAPGVSGKQARPWMRIRSSTWNGQARDYVDHGPMVASFRLVKTPYPLEEPLPTRPRQPVEIPLPLKGQWFVSQGAFGTFSHQKQWAYDLLVVDHEGHQSAPRWSENSAHHHAWGRPVFAPVDGRILYVWSGMEDLPARNMPDRRLNANSVHLDAGQGIGLQFSHLKKGSITVRAGDRVTAGQQIGLVGNSGYSFAPHLHIAARQPRFGSEGVPVAFTNVRVGLNPVPDDPWARDLASWEPRYGYFVESSLPSEKSRIDPRPRR